MSNIEKKTLYKINTNDSYYRHPVIRLFKDKHWSYIMKLYNLSPRETEIAELVCMGFSHKQISDELKIEHLTVKVHMRNIYRKVHVKNKITLLLTFIDDINKTSSNPGLFA